MKRTSNGRARRTEAEWAEIVSRYTASGLSLRAFCAREGVSQNSVSRWQRRLAGQAPSFVELAPPSAPTSGRPSCIVRLPDGTELRFGG